ncbi:ferritin-like domain-containing protein [Rhodobacter sp. SGA-6-6]|uniref:ferritin-like domain-containing protein n=1 Tax=Rhodobacter sp. SGA-6-6 TaxID=2710882 RepID=UPI0013EBD47C|nr:DUF892 family protein [Rhodobacter sp. SGA-6-6]NGM46136.1 ferritin-like domain-containing protein [Rhodobacter sp. SGA-6-6]
MEETREHYLAWLRDAHAMEEQALTMMRGMRSRLENYPDLSARIDRHIAETEGQAEDLRRLLEGQDTGSSVMKDAMARMTATGQALSGMFVGDEVVKGSMASYTFEHMEIAAYKVLIAAAKQLGETGAVAVFERILVQEQDMADWLFDHLDQTTQIFLARDEANLQAKR